VTASIVWFVFKRTTGITLEDALITYRYAENLASFRGFVFNPGERVLGTTSPLLALALGIMGHLLGIGLIPLLSNVLMALAALGSGLVVYAALRRLAIAPAWCALAAAFTLLSPEMLWVVPGGMETPLVLFLMAWSFWGVVAARWTQAGASLALLVLARADGMLWALVMLGLGVSRSSRATAKSLRTMAVVLLPWLVFQLAYFGSLIPQSIAAKSAFRPMDHSFGTYLRWFMPAFGAPQEPGWGAAPLWILVGLVLLAIRSALASSERRPLLAVAIYLPLYFVAMWLGHAPRTFPWYLVPPAWCSLLLAGVGLGALYESLARRRVLAGAIAIALLITLSTGAIVRGTHLASFHRDVQRNEDGLLRAVGVWVDQHASPNASVAMEAIGYQGTYAHRRVIDLAGLVSPDVVRIRQSARSNAGGFHAILDELHPDYLVLRSYEVDRNRLFGGGPTFETQDQADRFFATYEEAARFEAPLPALWGPLSFVTVYRRRM